MVCGGWLNWGSSLRRYARPAVEQNQRFGGRSWRTWMFAMKGMWPQEELEACPKDGYKYELVDGELIMSPVTANHGTICVQITSLFFGFVEPRRLGTVYGSRTGFRLSENVLLSPDI